MADTKTLDPYNRGGMWAFLLSFSFSIIFFIWIAFVHPGVNLKEIPAEVQQTMNPQGSQKNMAATAAAKAEPAGDPWVSSAAVIAKGQDVYKTNCAVCHGAEGKGDGPGSAGMARNLVEGKWKAGGDSISLFKTLQNGLPGTSMVSFKHLPVNDRWALVHYIRSITNNKVKDDPKAVAEFAASAK
ncbi:MAG: cytochrome c [Bdellovibrionales bacterium]|nr:cytochrome c [Bdellovibrionales bacterium]